MKNNWFFMASVCGLFFMVMSCNHSEKPSKPSVERDTLCVHVTAYNSLNYQTKAGNPAITAWGDTLQPSTKAIAISRDLIKKGLTHNTPVKIQGMSGTFLVKDKMHSRWKKRIDIYMGKNVKRARNFGKRQLEIYYVKNDSLAKKEVINQ